MIELEVELRIAPGEYLLRYRTPGAQVLARSGDGRRVQFPAAILQRFVTRHGINGRFRICCDDSGKLQDIDRLG